MHHGSCLCGKVAFEAVPPLRSVIYCHCSQCRRMSGHYWAATSVPHAQFHLTANEGLAWFRSSPDAERGFCSTCGASLFWQPEREARIAIAMGAFDNPSELSPERHIYTEDAGDYYAPEGPPAAPSAAPETLECACQCGETAFSVKGPAGPITACHCTQCRKLSGHYAASFDTHEAALTWHMRAKLKEYQSPNGGTRGFCSGCGSGLYFRDAKGGLSIEAGTVTGPTGGWLALHIYTASKGDYYEIDDGLPQKRGG